MAQHVSNARQQFVDDEMLRVPMLADQVLDATRQALSDGLADLSPHERAVVAELLQAVQNQRSRLIDRFAASVRQQVQAELNGTPPVVAAAAAPLKATLSLLDENEIAVDVEMSHAIQAIRSVAEHELRELASYTSALSGDMDVARDHNPFRAETYARAMWDASQVLALARGYQVKLMRQASVPLAQVLRKAYAGACARLESSGVEPAVYRTLILPAGHRTARPSDSWQGMGPDLNRILETMPAPPEDETPQRTSEIPLEHMLQDADRALRALPQDGAPTVRAQLLESQREHLVRHAHSPVDQQVIELLGRLFEAMLSDRRVPRDIRSVLARLQPSALRLVLRDESALDDYAHPVWRFMDMVAHQAGMFPDGSIGRDEQLRASETLIDEMAREAAPDAQLYERGLERLQSLDRQQLAARRQRAAADIRGLQATEDRIAESVSGVITGMGALDVSQLDTVPADLLESLPTSHGDMQDSITWLTKRRPGDWMRMFSQGRWLKAQLLWVGRHGDAWLFGDGQTDFTVAYRLRALERLHDEGLLTQLQVRSMLRSAAIQLLRNAGQPA